MEQVGPQKLVDQLKFHAPHYAKVLPELPMAAARISAKNADQGSDFAARASCGTAPDQPTVADRPLHCHGFRGGPCRHADHCSCTAVLSPRSIIQGFADSQRVLIYAYLRLQM